MKRTFLLIVGLVFTVTMAGAQGPVLGYEHLWTLSYEDLSDILRRYPGMYPLDYGTLGSPMLFRPWELNPWELRFERDLVPQNRRSDGIFDPNLQPAGELDTIRFDFLDGYAAGQFRTTTRHLPVDTPYTEFQIREGWYGLGTVDMAHGQRMYGPWTLEVTARLAWNNGLRDNTESKLQRVRGRVGFDLGKRWRAGLTYAGSNADAQFPGTAGPYSEREEAIFELDEKDSLRTPLNPSLRLYVRQDREEWGTGFRLREGVGGIVGQFHAAAGAHHLRLKPSASYSELDYHGARELYETTAEIMGQDSVALGFAGVRVFGLVRGEVIANSPTDSWDILPAGGVEANARIAGGLSGFAGLHYVKELWPVAWSYARYRLSDRPILVAPEFADPNLSYVGSLLATGEPYRGEESYRKAMGGLRWTRGNAQLECTGMVVDRWGSRADGFAVVDTSITNTETYSANDGKYIMSLTAQVPLFWGMRVDSWDHAQFDEDGNRRETRTYSRLYFERAFFAAPLIVRSHISHEYVGPRSAYLDAGTQKLPASNLIGFRLSATIHGVTLIWGTENFFKQHYQYVPGYNMIAKEEYIGVIWRLWL